MRCKGIVTGLACAALLLAGSAGAQDRTGRDVAMPASPAGEDPVADASLAQQLYAWGVRQDSAVAVATAARIMLSVTFTDVSRTVAQAPTPGADIPDPGQSAEAPPDGAAMLARARAMAAGDDALLALISDIENDTSKGHIGGTSRTLSQLPAGFTDTWKIPFQGDAPAELAIMGNGQSDLDLKVTDQDGNMICFDQSYLDQLYCTWTPRWDGEYLIRVINAGRARNAYYILTN